MSDDWIDKPYDAEQRFAAARGKNIAPDFWQTKKLEKMTPDEWELLCDGCGKCCLNKIEIRREVKFTRAACRFLDCESGLCRIYEHRFDKVSDCRLITLEAVREQPRWLPKTCAYWRLDNGLPLPDWHPLITGRAASVHEAGMSVRGRGTVSESGVKDYEDYVVDWPDL